jgi:tetratricopeptide (TPR) repeat protein
MSANEGNTATVDRAEELKKWQTLSEEGHSSFENKRYSQAEARFLEALRTAEKLAGIVNLKAPKDVVAFVAPAQTAIIEYDLKGVGTEDQVRLTKSLNNLAALYHLQGKYQMAEDVYETCLDIKLALYGDQHLETAINIHNMAALQCARKRWEKAEILYKRALEIRETLLGDDHVDLIPILKNYSIMLRKLVREDEAKTIEQRIASIDAKSGQI